MTTIGIVLMALGFVIVLFNETPEPAPITHAPTHEEPKETYDPYEIFDSVFTNLNYNYNQDKYGLHYKLRETETNYCLDVMIGGMITFSYDWIVKKEFYDKESFVKFFSKLATEQIRELNQAAYSDLRNAIDMPYDLFDKIKALNKHRASKMAILLDENDMSPSTANPSIYYSADTVTLNLGTYSQPVYSFKKFTSIYRIVSPITDLKKQGKTPTKLILSEGDRLIINSYGDIKSITILGIECTVEGGEETEFVCEPTDSQSNNSQIKNVRGHEDRN